MCPPHARHQRLRGDPRRRHQKSLDATTTNHLIVTLRDRQFAEGLGLSITVDGVTRLSASDVERCDWLQGTVARIYGLPVHDRGRDHLRSIAIRDHVGRLAKVHPADVVVDGTRAWPAERPQEKWRLSVDGHGDEVIVRS